jgi:hypothetical protein
MKTAYDVTKGIGLVTPGFFRVMTGPTRWTAAGIARALSDEKKAGVKASNKAWKGETTKVITRKDCSIKRG